MIGFTVACQVEDFVLRVWAGMRVERRDEASKPFPLPLLARGVKGRVSFIRAVQEAQVDRGLCSVLGFDPWIAVKGG